MIPIGYWRIPVDKNALEEAEGLIAGGGVFRKNGVGVRAPVAYATRWRDTMLADDNLPDPRDFVTPNWPHKHRVVAYLKKGEVKESWMGFSLCRFCGTQNGSKCLTDGVYIWPEGLAHYVDAHDVALPDEFVAHVEKTPW